MFKTLVIPVVVGLACLLITMVAIQLIKPFINLDIDPAVMGLVEMILWIAAFSAPAEYLRKKAKNEIESAEKA
jgi:hypothetical protein